jgi:diaminohydroxyphosphoribosylaminopyrimidine deaminase/5-amino-6-(5-phosphoribosylamino)uracil reductase
MVTPDELFMKRTFELARLGMGNVSPNPCVGCVVVSDGRIIGEGWHQHYGGAHAEVNAVQAVADKRLLRGASVYVNLEPCSHFGKTPPCADLLIAQDVKRVFISTPDSNPLVSGQGIRKLMEAGIDVHVGVSEQEGRELNKRFFVAMENRRPFVILKWAQTADGFIAKMNFESRWISNSYSRQLVHQWRSQEDAVLVGTRTAEHDNPALTVRDWSGRNPIRVVIDRLLRLPRHLALFDGSQMTYSFNLLKQEEHKNLFFIRLKEEDFLKHLMAELYERKIHSLLVEGGKATLEYFIKSGLWDEARVFYTPVRFETGITAPAFRGTRVAGTDVIDDRLEIFKP